MNLHFVLSSVLLGRSCILCNIEAHIPYIEHQFEEPEASEADTDIFEPKQVLHNLVRAHRVLERTIYKCRLEIESLRSWIEELRFRVERATTDLTLPSYKFSTFLLHKHNTLLDFTIKECENQLYHLRNFVIVLNDAIDNSSEIVLELWKLQDIHLKEEFLIKANDIKVNQEKFRLEINVTTARCKHDVAMSQESQLLPNRESYSLSNLYLKLKEDR